MHPIAYFITREKRLVADKSQAGVELNRDAIAPSSSYCQLELLQRQHPLGFQKPLWLILPEAISKSGFVEKPSYLQTRGTSGVEAPGRRNHG